MRPTQQPPTQAQPTQTPPGAPAGYRAACWAVTVAAVLLWALAGFGWLPIALGLAVLVLVRLLGRLVGFAGLLTPRRMTLIAPVVFLAATTLRAPSGWALGAAIGAGVLTAGLLLRSRQLMAAGVVVAILGGIGHALVMTGQQQAQHEQRERENEILRARMLPRSPTQALQAFMTMLARNDTDIGCSIFDDTARRQLADAHHVADCPAAITALHRQVSNPREYDDYGYGSATITHSTPGAAVSVDGCRLWWGSVISGRIPDAGPQPGRLTVTQHLGEGYKIIGYQRCTG